MAEQNQQNFWWIVFVEEIISLKRKKILILNFESTPAHIGRIFAQKKFHSFKQDWNGHQRTNFFTYELSSTKNHNYPQLYIDKVWATCKLKCYWIESLKIKTEPSNGFHFIRSIDELFKVLNHESIIETSNKGRGGECVKSTLQIRDMYICMRYKFALNRRCFLFWFSLIRSKWKPEWRWFPFNNLNIAVWIA